MSQPANTLLEEALEAWTYAREGVIEEAANIGGDSYDWRPHEDARSVRELILHIVESGMMMAGELSRPDGDFQRLSFQLLLGEHAAGLPVDAGPAELRDVLRSSLVEGVAMLRSVGELHMLQLIRRFDGNYGTRLAWMHHGVSHEEYHRGQLAMYARAMGLVPALTQLIHGGG
ncbi:MAG TPA: DinB family protein [Longimicrobiales bacterium]|nr:DinB family protein [Longimicrobiales bacterium]